MMLSLFLSDPKLVLKVKVNLTGCRMVNISCVYSYLCHTTTAFIHISTSADTLSLFFLLASLLCLEVVHTLFCITHSLPSVSITAISSICPQLPPSVSLLFLSVC